MSERYAGLYVRLTVRDVLRRWGLTTDDGDEGIGLLWEKVL